MVGAKSSLDGAFHYGGGGVRVKKKKNLLSFKVPMSLYNIVYVFSYLPMFRISATYT